jgi:hypothetical protein
VAAKLSIDGLKPLDQVRDFTSCIRPASCRTEVRATTEWPVGVDQTFAGALDRAAGQAPSLAGGNSLRPLARRPFAATSASPARQVWRASGESKLAALVRAHAAALDRSLASSA